MFAPLLHIIFDRAAPSIARWLRGRLDVDEEKATWYLYGMADVVCGDPRMHKLLLDALIEEGSFIEAVKRMIACFAMVAYVGLKERLGGGPTKTEELAQALGDLRLGEEEARELVEALRQFGEGLRRALEGG